MQTQPVTHELTPKHGLHVPGRRTLLFSPAGLTWLTKTSSSPSRWNAALAPDWRDFLVASRTGTCCGGHLLLLLFCYSSAPCRCDTVTHERRSCLSAFWSLHAPLVWRVFDDRCPLFGEAVELPSTVFPWLVAFGADGLGAFEAAATVLANWGRQRACT